MDSPILPWTRDTFPNGMIYIRMKTSLESSTPDGILNNGIRMGVRIIQWGDLYRNYEWSVGHHPTKATWNTCGAVKNE